MDHLPRSPPSDTAAVAAACTPKIADLLVNNMVNNMVNDNHTLMKPIYFDDQAKQCHTLMIRTPARCSSMMLALLMSRCLGAIAT